MQKLKKSKVLNNHFWTVYLLAAVLVCVTLYYQWMIGVLMALLLATSFIYSFYKERALSYETQKYISGLTRRIDKTGNEALLELPLGIVLYDQSYHIEWLNPYMKGFSNENITVGQSLNVFSGELIALIKEGHGDFWFPLGDYEFQAIIKKEERLLYLFDRTSQVDIQTLYLKEQTVLAIIFLDNYEEITQTMDDTLKSRLNSTITSVLNDWAHQYGLYLKRTSQDRFLAIGTKDILQSLEDQKFDILDIIRQSNLERKQRNPVTLSIGIGVGSTSLPTLGEIAQSSLDLALGRGGDQVAIKDAAGKVRFYGGNTNPMEKRTRVRARVISHALKELVKESDKVIIMGHQSPDMDSLGASIGVLNIVKSNDVDGYIIFDPDDMNEGIYRIVETLKKDADIWKHFVTPDGAEEIITDRSLIVVVDTHKPSMVSNARILNRTEYKVIIDHHRRGEDFIENPTLVYMEPYASSTAELVTELLEYQPNHLPLKMIEATSLLAGIIVDTKSFTLRTGSRTFDAASYLRAKGADTVLVQQFMKEDLDSYIKRSRLIERAVVYFEKVAISKAQSGEVYDQVLIAQAADTLLTMNGVNASFVISERNDGKISISARSLGEINVQVIMEKLNGGGHLTNAATQIEASTTDHAEALLKNILYEYFEGSNES